MERLAQYPAETMLAVPAAPDDALRGVLVLQGIAREAEAEAAAIRREQAALDAATAALHAEAPKLAAAEAAQQAEASALDRQIAAAKATRRNAEGDAAEAARRAQALAAQAGSLKAAIAAIETARRAPEARERAERMRPEAARPGKRTASVEPATPPARGALRLPVAGTLVRAFGAATDAGPSAGASYQTPPNARVVSPCRGRVEFAAPFRSYGRLLIVSCGGGMHIVLAGLDRLDADPGEAVQPGEPVGTMPDWRPGSGGSRPALYVELRRDGQPVDPGPWFGKG